MTAIIGEIEKRGLTDTFGLGQLVADKNAREALAALTRNIDDYRALLADLREGSAGTVDADFEDIAILGATAADRRSAALGAAGRQMGARLSSVNNWFWESITRAVSPDYNRQRTAESVADLPDADIERRIAEMETRLAFAEGRGHDAYAAELRTTFDPLLELLRGELAARRDGSAADQPETTPRIAPADVPELENPVDTLDPVEMPAVDAPAEPLAGFETSLDEGLERSKSKVSAAVSEMKAMLNFTAAPTIAPQVTAPTNRATTRRERRDTRAARNGALHDTGATQ